jgi:hypothetical protein
MNEKTQIVPEPETEQDRQRLLQELSADEGADWAERYRPGSYGCHELLDRVSLAGDALESQVLSHPACVQNPAWYALADQAVRALRTLYQHIGEDHLGDRP